MKAAQGAHRHLVVRAEECGELAGLSVGLAREQPPRRFPARLRREVAVFDDHRLGVDTAFSQTIEEALKTLTVVARSTRPGDDRDAAVAVFEQHLGSATPRHAVVYCEALVLHAL